MIIFGALVYFILFGIVFPSYVGKRLDFDRCGWATSWIVSGAPFAAFWFGWFAR